MTKRYVIELSAEERERLEALCRGSRGAARRLTRAWALLLCDRGEGGRGGPMRRSPKHWG